MIFVLSINTINRPLFIDLILESNPRINYYNLSTQLFLFYIKTMHIVNLIIVSARFALRDRQAPDRIEKACHR